MRHVIHVVGSQVQLETPPPRIQSAGSENRHETTWYACADQQHPANLLDDTGSAVLRFLRSLVLCYRFYQLVHGVKLWSGSRPLILIRERSFSGRVAAYAGTWGGGDVVMPETAGETPYGPTRFILDENGELKLHAD